MLHKLISHSPDLKKLWDEGFVLEIKGGHLLVHDVPYVNSQKEIAYGTLVTVLSLVGAGEKTAKPETHVIYFTGEYPCDKDGNPIRGIQHSSQNQEICEGVKVNHSFSNKPRDRMYEDYYEKISTYVNIISSHAQFIEPSVTAKTFKFKESNDPESVFNYPDTNSSRAGISAVSSKLKNLKVAITGLGGTGSYVLDFVAKTPVKEIHLFDGDGFLLHNAFRTPGAPSAKLLREEPKKVSYLHEIYSKMHKRVIPHENHLLAANVDEISGMDFVFICIDEGGPKKAIVEKLLTDGIPFIDVGIGVEVVDGLLRGSARVTSVTRNKNDHVNRRISFSDDGNDAYSQNIQIAELNALNAALAVIKWKKLFGYYHDFEKEFNTVYNVDVNQLVDDETIT